MKRYKDLKEQNKVPEPTGDLKDACWKGYTAVGLKKKGGKMVPNCVPVKEDNEGPPSVAAATLKDKPNKEPMPKLKEENDTTEKIEMSQSQLHFIHYACEEILEYIEDGGEVEEWYQVKIAKAFSEFESLHSFMEGEKRRTGMVKEAWNQPDYSQSIKARQAKADRDSAPFDADKKPVTRVKPGKQGVGPATARHLAKMAMQRQMKKEGVDDGTRYHKLYPHVPLNDYAGHEYHKLSDEELERHRAHQKERHEKLGDKKAGKNADVAKGIQIHRARQLMKKEETEQIDEISSELAGKVSDARFKRVMANPQNQSARDKFKRASGSAIKRITRDMIRDPEKANRGFASDADENRKRGWSNESVEQIDELSKKTLGSYIKSASHDVAARAAATRQHSVDAHRKMADQDFTGGRESMKKSDKSFADSWKRRQNMAKAVDRLTKEEDEKMTEPFLKTSRKTEIVKGAAKKKNGKTDKFEAEPILSSTVTRNN